MNQTFIGVLKELVGILRDGGPYAVSAVFLMLWFFERRENRILRKEGTGLAVAQVENNVKTEMTLTSLKEALSGVKHKLEELKTEFQRICVMKESLLKLIGKPEIKLLESNTETDKDSE